MASGSSSCFLDRSFVVLRVSAKRRFARRWWRGAARFSRESLRNRESLGFSIHPPICQSVSNPFHNNSRSHSECLASERASTIAHRAESQAIKFVVPSVAIVCRGAYCALDYTPYRGNYQRIFVSGQIS